MVKFKLTPSIYCGLPKNDINLDLTTGFKTPVIIYG